MARLDVCFGLDEGNGEADQYMEQALLEAEMTMQNSSIGYEYAKIELAKSRNYLTQEELLAQMDYLKQAYFAARNLLEQFKPDRLTDVEEEILFQKQTIFVPNQHLHS